MKKILALVLAMLMVAGMMSAFAADPEYTITVNNPTGSNLSIVGKTFYAHKLFDLVYSGDNYAYSIKTDNTFYSNTSAKAVLDTYFDFTAVASDPTTMTVTVKEAKQNSEGTLSAADVRALADALQPYIPASSSLSATATGESVVIDVKAPGYYLVSGDAFTTYEGEDTTQETVVSAIMIDNADKTAEINLKAEGPTLDKEIKKVKEGTTEVADALLDEDGQAAVAKVGSTVSYELKSAVPDLTGYDDYTFKISDTITEGLDYVKSTFTLTIGTATVEIAPVFATGDKSFTLTIPYDTLKTYTKGTAIKLAYDCVVNSNALTYDYEKNTANLEYSHSPYDDTTNHTPDEKTYVIDLNLDVLKVDGKDSTKKLDGAEFKLYKDNAEGNNYYKWDATNGKVTWVAEADADTFTTDTNGKFTQQIRGLDKGTYYLLETAAPTGYNKLPSAITVVISAVEGTDKVTYSATYGGEAATMTNGEISLASNAHTANQPVAAGTIENNSGAELPSTGGIGTTIFYIGGSILVLAAAVLLITKRRMGNQD